MMVKDREACVCQIVEVLGLAPSTVSNHLSILKTTGLIDSYKQGRWNFYYTPQEPSKKVSHALRWVVDSLEDSEVINKDNMTGTIVCKQVPEELARQQRER